MASRKQIPIETLIALRQQLEEFPERSIERKKMIQNAARRHNVSSDTIYRALRSHHQPKPIRRSDYGFPRILPQEKMEYYCEVVAALKLRTLNKKGRCLSTVRAIRLLEEHGIQVANDFVKVPPSLLKKSTVNYYLKLWGYDRKTLTIQPVAVRFQAQFSNECWQFDLSHSDLKSLNSANWKIDEKGNPLLMLYSVVDDRSGVCYQEYHKVYGEDVSSALQFLFRAMSIKEIDNFPFRGIPKMIYMDNGPISKSKVFQRVMEYLGVNIRIHMPQGKDGRRITSRSKGKVERAFRTVKEVHETLYHFHQPETEEEANSWLK